MAISRAMAPADAAEEPVEESPGEEPQPDPQRSQGNNEALRRQLSQMKTLFGIGKVVTSLLSLDQILERVLDAAAYLTNAEESIIWLPESKSGVLRAYTRKGGGGKDRPVLSLSIRDSQVGQVMRSGRPVRLYTGTGQGFKIKTGYLARALMYVPLMVRGKALGVLSVTNRLSPRAFSERDEFLLTALADYAAIALQNARIFRATDQALAAGADELRTLVEITRNITSTLDLDEIARRTIRQVYDSWKVEACSIWLLDRDGGKLRVLANVGTPADPLKNLEVPMGEGIVGYVVQTGKAISTNDVANHPLHYRVIDQATGFLTRTLLCVPLVFRDATIGALQLLNKASGDFTDRDVDRARSMGVAVAIAVSNALLYQALEARRAALEHTVGRIQAQARALHDAGPLNKTQLQLLQEIAAESGQAGRLFADYLDNKPVSTTSGEKS